MEEYKLPNGETAKQIIGFDDYYITESGGIYSTRWRYKFKDLLELPKDLRRVKTSKVTSRRYEYANIYSNEGGRASLRVHRIVYQYFNTKGECLMEGFVIDHIDNDRTNNHISNLQQITPQENTIKWHHYDKKD
jgi:hypothetical protein